MLPLLVACIHEPIVPLRAPDMPGADVLHFDLAGVDRIDLIESCWSTCPHDEADRPVASLTTWAVDWNWVRGPAEPCEVIEPTVVVDVTVTLPRWAPPPSSDPALVDEWNTYLIALTRHEQGHVELVHTLTDNTAATLVDAGCEGAHAAGAALIDRIRTAQRNYDEGTGSGRTQGASFWGM